MDGAEPLLLADVTLAAKKLHDEAHQAWLRGDFAAYREMHAAWKEAVRKLWSTKSPAIGPTPGRQSPRAHTMQTD
jgi:hypothetical protein